MQTFALFISGLGIGLLAGFSVSPVIGAVLAALITAAATVTAVLGGYQEAKAEEKSGSKTKTNKLGKVTALPLMFLVLGVVLGSALGVYGRIAINQSLNNPKPAQAPTIPLPDEQVTKVMEAWKQLGVSEDELRLRLLNLYLPSASGDTSITTNPEDKGQVAGLYGAASAEDCQELKNSPDALLAQRMALSTDKLAAYAKSFNNQPDSLREVVRIECGF
ncbi:MAG: hypothetical protein R2880_12215 [Deinococcales bacterium]